MKTKAPPTPCWSTASLGHAVDTSPLELAALGQHLQRCRGTGGPLSVLQAAAQTMTGFASTRFVTTLLALALLIGAGFLIF